MGKVPQSNKTFRCKGCGDVFECKTRKRELCNDCKRVKQMERVQRYKKRVRATFKKQHLRGGSGFIEMIGGATYDEIGRVLGLSRDRVETLERKALTQIRANPELQKCLATIREVMAEGHPMPELGLLRRDFGATLLNYQMELARWWQDHDQLAGAESHAEVAELARELEALWRTIDKALTAKAGDRHQ